MRSFILMLCAFLLSGCGTHLFHNIHDPHQNLTKDDFHALTQQPEAMDKPDVPMEPPQESMADQLPALPLDPLDDVRITLDVDEAVPVMEILEGIAKQANLGLFLGRNLAGSVRLKVKEQPLRDVVDSLCDMTGLVCTIRDTTLYARQDKPYSHTYDMRVLALKRGIKSDIAVNTSMIGISSGASGTTTQGNGSKMVVSNEAQNYFWEDLEKALTHIIGGSAEKKTKKGAKRHLQKKGKRASFSVHPQAGLVTLYGTHKQHRLVAAYLKKLRQILSGQILIEAKVVEVQLKDEYRMGIDWHSQFKGAVNFGANFGTRAQSGSMFGQTGSVNDISTLTVEGAGLSSLLKMMDSFGTVRTLSSPRLTVMNNQTALMKVADNQVFFRISYDRQTYMDGGHNPVVNYAVNSKVETVPVGFIMTVQPVIDTDNQEIVLNLRPTITRITGVREDPAVTLMARERGDTQVNSEIPIIAVREMDSILRMKSGEVAILGGLMQQGSQNLSSGLPGFKETPLKLFTESRVSDQSVVELVIFIKATILDGTPRPKVRGADRRLYDNYFNDPRPLFDKETSS